MGILILLTIVWVGCSVYSFIDFYNTKKRYPIYNQTLWNHYWSEHLLLGTFYFLMSVLYSALILCSLGYLIGTLL